MISYSYNSDKNIVETIFSGMIEPKEILDFMLDINKDETLPRKLNAIIDVRDADFVFEPIAIQNIVKANFRMNRSFSRIHNAIVANDPQDPTLSLFHQYVHDSLHYKVEIFDDKEKALAWLKKSK